MFQRVERKMDALLREMPLRTGRGAALLPSQLSHRAADGSATQKEMPFAAVRQFVIGIKSSATAQRRRFALCSALPWRQQRG
jgi:hypothetical protein